MCGCTEAEQGGLNRVRSDADPLQNEISAGLRVPGDDSADAERRKQVRTCQAAGVSVQHAGAWPGMLPCSAQQGVSMVIERVGGRSSAWLSGLVCESPFPAAPQMRSKRDFVHEERLTKSGRPMWWRASSCTGACSMRPSRR